MRQFIEAIYTDGVLKPTRDLDLREGQRVRIIVEPIDDERPERSAALATLRAGIASMHFSLNNRLPSRDQLHSCS
jgi:predicted DNA-binding antitoxin AbrB/MazE fold protein